MLSAFLTVPLLSPPRACSSHRSFCLMEIGWAIEFKKPIIIVREADPRFFQFDIERWHTNRCTRSAQDGTWVTGWLSREYKQVSRIVEGEKGEHGWIETRERKTHKTSTVSR